MKFAIYCFLFICATLLIAQKDYYQIAEANFASERYYEAIEAYKKAYTKVKDQQTKAEILFKIGECYRLIYENENAAEWYSKAEKALYSNPILYLRFGEVLHLQGKYEDAYIKISKYMEMYPNDSLGILRLKSTELAMKELAKPAQYVVINEQQLNTKFEDFAPNWLDKKKGILCFTSTREGSTGTSVDPRTGENFSDLYSAQLDKKSKWSVPLPLPPEINTPHNEGVMTISSKGNIMFFTRCQYVKKEKMGCKIFYSELKGKAWSMAEFMDLGLSDTLVTAHPALTPDDKYLVFVSNMPGGFGENDLWIVSVDLKNKKWGSPKNLGPYINTPYNEMFPWISEDGTLYFASDGHPGFGGLDIFKAKRKAETEWDSPVNLGHPINSEGDDFGIVFISETEGFLSSSRKGGKGKSDIYRFKKRPTVFVIQGFVRDYDTKQPLENAKVKLIGSDGSIFEISTDKNGFYKFDKMPDGEKRYVLPNTNYTLIASKEGYLNAKSQESTVGIEESTLFQHDFELQSVKKKEIRLPLVLFEFDSWKLTKEGMDSLEYLYNILIDNPNIVIELAAHTDSRGSDEYNWQLSQRRAEACAKYLISKGIHPSRIVPKGYGETKLLIPDSEIDKMATEDEKEAAHAINRRVVFTVIRTDFQPPPTNNQ